MATVIPFPAVRLDDPADMLFVALMRGAEGLRGQVIDLATWRMPAWQDNEAAGLKPTQTA